MADFSPEQLIDRNRVVERYSYGDMSSLFRNKYEHIVIGVDEVVPILLPIVGQEYLHSLHPSLIDTFVPRINTASVSIAESIIAIVC